MEVKEDRVVNVHKVIEKLEESLQKANQGNTTHYINILKAMFSYPPEPMAQCRPPDTYPEIPQ